MILHLCISLLFLVKYLLSILLSKRFPLFRLLLLDAQSKITNLKSLKFFIYIKKKKQFFIHVSLPPHIVKLLVLKKKRLKNKSKNPTHKHRFVILSTSKELSKSIQSFIKKKKNLSNLYYYGSIWDLLILLKLNFLSKIL